MELSKLAVVGSRTITNYNVVSKFIGPLVKEHWIGTIISGGAKGVDTIAREYAKINNLEYIEYPANWNLYGKKAGYKRNQLIVDNSDYVVAFWDGQSKGTMHTVDLAKKAGKLVKFYKLNKV